MVLFLLLTALNLVLFTMLFLLHWSELVRVCVFAINSWLTVTAWVCLLSIIWQTYVTDNALYATTVVSFWFWYFLYEVNTKDTSAIDQASEALSKLSSFEKEQKSAGKFVAASQLKKWVPVKK